MKIVKRLSVLLLSFGMMLVLTAPALAVPSGSFALLNVKYAPNGMPINGIEFFLYKVASARVVDGQYVYTLTEDFAGSGIDINELMAGGQVTDSSTQRQLLSSFGTYINDNSSAVAGSVLAAATSQVAIGTGGVLTDGVAQFTGLEDGLYLGSTNRVVTLNGTEYTAVPFLINLPYVFEGTVNNLVTVNLKYVTSTPTPPDDPDEPIDVPPITDVEDDPPPVTPTDPTAPDPVPDPAPDPVLDPAADLTADDPTADDLAAPDPEASDPEAVLEDEPVVDILPEEVPLANLPEDEDLLVEIPEAEVPMARLPQTGLLWWPVPVMAVGGVACVGLGVFSRKRNNE